MEPSYQQKCKQTKPQSYEKVGMESEYSHPRVPVALNYVSAQNIIFDITSMGLFSLFKVSHKYFLSMRTSKWETSE